MGRMLRFIFIIPSASLLKDVPILSNCMLFDRGVRFAIPVPYAIFNVAIAPYELGFIV
jgi:hypothetical protein